MLLKPRGWELQTGLCKSAGVNSHALPTSRPRQALVEASAWISCCKVNIGSAPKSPEYMSVKRAGPAGRPHLEGSGHPACSGVGSSEPQGAAMTPSTHGSKLYTLPHVHCPAWSSAALGSDVDSPAQNSRLPACVDGCSAPQGRATFSAQGSPRLPESDAQWSCALIPGQLLPVFLPPGRFHLGLYQVLSGRDDRGASWRR